MSSLLNQLSITCKNCTNCALSQSRTNVVFGVGNENAEVMFIGEGPGENEDLTGEPFVGKGGILLDKYLTAIDLSRNKNIYIANMVKCRPPQNRDPSQEEIACCMGFLRKQVSIIKPKIIVCLGRVAAIALIDKSFKITKQHGEWFENKGFFMMATYHPAALLRNPDYKPMAFEDMLSLESKIREVCTRTY